MTGFAVKLSALLNFIFNNPVVYKYFCLNSFLSSGKIAACLFQIVYFKYTFKVYNYILHLGIIS